MLRNLILAGLVVVAAVYAAGQTSRTPIPPRDTARMVAAPRPAPPVPVAKPTATPRAPVAPPPPTGPVAPTFDVVRISPTGEAVIAGRAEPGTTVTVLDGGHAVGSTMTNARGEWVLLPETVLSPGSRELTLSGDSAAALKPVVSNDVVLVVVPGPAAPATGPAADVRRSEPPPEALAVSLSRDRLGSAVVLQAPPTDSETVPPGGVTVESVDYDDKGNIALGGRATPGSAVQLYLDNVLVGRAHTDPDGHWRLSPERLIDPGLYSLRADQVTETGKVTARVELPVQVSQIPPDMAPDRSIVVQPGNSLWRIAQRTYDDGYRYINIYRANREQIRDPDLIYPGQIFTLPVSN